MLKIFTQDSPLACLGGPRTDGTAGAGIVTSILRPRSTSHRRGRGGGGALHKMRTRLTCPAFPRPKPGFPSDLALLWDSLLTIFNSEMASLTKKAEVGKDSQSPSLE